MEVGNLWVRLGLGADEFKKGLRESEKDARTFGNALTGVFKTAAVSAQASLRSLSQVRISDIARMPEFKSTIGELKQLQLDYALTTSKMKLSATEAEKFQAQLNYLNQVLEIHRRGMDTVRQAYEKSVAEKGKDATETKRLETQLKRLQITEANLENAVKETESAIKNQGRAAAQTEKQITNFGSSLKNIIKIAAGTALGVAGFQGITAAIRGSVGAGIEFDAQMQQAQIAFQTMLGSAKEAQDLLEQLQEFAAKTPFEFPELQDAAKRMLAFGFAAEDIMPMLKATGDAAAGLGLSGSEGINRIIIALGQLRAKGRIQAQEMLQLTEAGIPAWDILAKAMGKSTAEVMKLSEKGLIPADQAIQALVKGMEERFPNMMDKQSKSFSGLMSTLRDNLNITFGTVMKPAFDWLTNIALPQVISKLETFTGTLRSAGMAEAIKTIIPPGIVEAFLSVGRAVEYLVGVIKTLFPILLATGASFVAFKAAIAISSVVGAVASSFAVLREAIIMYRSGVQLATISQWAFNSALLASPIGWVLAAVGALAAGIYALSKAWDSNTKSVDDTTIALRNQLKATQENIKQKQSEATVMNQQIQTLTELKNQYLTLSRAAAQSELSDRQLAATKAKLAGVEQQLIPIIGEEGLEKIKQAKNTEQAFNAEIQAMQDKLNAHKKAVEEARNLEFTQTMNLIKATEARIAAIEAEKSAYDGWSKIKVGFLSSVKEIEEKLAEATWLPKGSIEIHKKTAANLQKSIDSIIEASKAKPLAEARSELSRLREQLISLGDIKLGGIDLSKWGLAGVKPGQSLADIEDVADKTSKKAAKAAEDTRAAWEKTADIFNTRLDILKTKYELAAIAAEMKGEKAKTLADKIAALNNQLEVQKQIVAAVTLGYEESVQAKGADAEETLKLALRLEQEKKAQADIEKQIYDTNQSLKDQAQELRNLAGEVSKLEEEYEAATKKMRDDLAAAAEEYRRKVAEVNNKLVEDERRVTEEYEKAVSDRAKALRDFVGLFDKVTTREVTGKELLENLRGQVQTFEEWSTNIQALAARGVDEGLIQELREMGPKAAPEIAALLTLTDEELLEYQNLWRTKTEDARAEAVSQLEQQRVEMQQKLIEIRIAAQEQLEAYRAEWEKKNAEIRKNAEEEMKRIERRFKDISEAGTKYGISLMTNFVGGIESQFDRLRQVLEEAAALVDSYMPHSPAKVGPLKRLNEWGPALIGELVSGIKSNLPKLGATLAAGLSLPVANLGVNLGAGIPAVSGTALAGVSGGTVINFYFNGNKFSSESEYRQLEDWLLRKLDKAGVRR